MIGKVNIVPHTIKVQSCHLEGIYIKNLGFWQFLYFYLAPFFNTVCYNENMHTVITKWFESWFYSHYRLFLCRRAFITQWTAVGGGSWQPCCVHEEDARGGWLRLHCRKNNASHRGAGFNLAVCCGPHHQQTSEMNFRFVCPADVVCILTSQNWQSVLRHKHGLFQLLLSFSYFSGIFWKFAWKVASKRHQHHGSAEAVNKKRQHYLVSDVSAKQNTVVLS